MMWDRFRRCAVGVIREDLPAIVGLIFFSAAIVIAIFGPYTKVPTVCIHMYNGGYLECRDTEEARDMIDDATHGRREWMCLQDVDGRPVCVRIGDVQYFSSSYKNISK